MSRSCIVLRGMWSACVRHVTITCWHHPSLLRCSRHPRNLCLPRSLVDCDHVFGLYGGISGWNAEWQATTRRTNLFFSTCKRRHNFHSRARYLLWKLQGKFLQENKQMNAHKIDAIHYPAITAIVMPLWTSQQLISIFEGNKWYMQLLFTTEQ